ncbi:hypothetical protein [Sinomonas sp.]|uniref:hypothetical protein n=1 Tax=Sinomonas sp. TaxID=1914986 RepID=UPI002FE3B96D
MTPTKKRMGRPSLGPRDAFNVKLSPEDGRVIRMLAEVQGRSYQDVLEPLISAAIAQIDLEQILDHAAGQEALPIARAS